MGIPNKYIVRIWRIPTTRAFVAECGAAKDHELVRQTISG